MREYRLSHRLTLIVAWYDLWIGVFVDRPKRRVYVFPLPCVGVRVQIGRDDSDG